MLAALVAGVMFSVSVPLVAPAALFALVVRVSSPVPPIRLGNEFRWLVIAV